jgi:hypothetical protein
VIGASGWSDDDDGKKDGLKRRLAVSRNFIPLAEKHFFRHSVIVIFEFLFLDPERAYIILYSQLTKYD